MIFGRLEKTGKKAKTTSRIGNKEEEMFIGFFRMRRSVMAVFFGSVLVLGLSVHEGYAQPSKKVDQLNFQLPEDWPVEKRGGLITPIPTEEYVSMKFKEVEKEFESVREEFSLTSDGLREDLKAMEERFSRQAEEFQSQEAALGDRKKDAGALKNELGRLDEKLTARMKETQERLEQIGLQIESIKKSLKDIQAHIYKLDEKVDYWQENELRSY
jgi:archaellum component FlaC